MNNSRITYAQRGDAGPGDEVAALTNIYRLVLDSAKQRGRNPDECITDNTILGNAKEVDHVGRQLG